MDVTPAYVNVMKRTRVVIDGPRQPSQGGKRQKN